MRTVNEYAAALRGTSDPTQRRRLENGLANVSTVLVHRTMRRMLAGAGGSVVIEDAAQELVSRFVGKVREAIEPPRHGAESGYLQRSARNRAIDVLTSKAKYRYRDDEAFVETDGVALVDPYGKAEADATDAGLRRVLAEVLDELPDNHREVIEKRYFAGMKFTEIGEQWFREGRAASGKKGEQNAIGLHRTAMRTVKRLAKARIQEGDA